MFSLHHPIRRGGFTRLRRVQKDISCKALLKAGCRLSRNLPRLLRLGIS